MIYNLLNPSSTLSRENKRPFTAKICKYRIGKEDETRWRSSGQDLLESWVGPECQCLKLSKSSLCHRVKLGETRGSKQ